MKDTTLDYYQKEAEAFAGQTRLLDMSALYEPFLQYLPDNGWILDFGCGSGRDSKAFLDLGYQVDPLDGSPNMARQAEGFLCHPVTVMDFRDYVAERQYDGIWACASLLHLNEKDLVRVLKELEDSLVPGGILYASFKFGDGERMKNGRYFLDMNEEHLQTILKNLPGLKPVSIWYSEDVREERKRAWINILLQKEEHASLY